MSKPPIIEAYRQLLKRGRLSVNTGQEALVERLGRLQADLVAEEGDDNLRGLYIYGDVGTGKSRMADLFAATIPRQVSRRRIHFHEFMMDIHARLHRAHSAAGYAGDPLVKIGREVAAESRLLCFDEFQITDIADGAILKRLFGSIWQSGGLMVSTSNRHPDNLYEKGLNRPLVIPFLKELQRRCEVWKMEGHQDYRMKSQDRESDRDQVFFTDQVEYEDNLKSFIGKSPLTLTTIPVMMGRELHVQASQVSGKDKTIVSTTFHDLCERNVGSADYHALCKKADIIYLSGLRQFKEDQLDFVRRFVTLLDLAYESRTRIVCLSAVPLFEVFQKIVPSQRPVNDAIQEKLEEMSVRKGGGSSSSMMSTFIGEMEWSATGLPASLASGGAGESDVKFAIGRAVSRLFEMGSKQYGLQD